MTKFVINPKIKSLFNKTGRKPIMRIKFLGTGGAFHPHLGSSSALLQFGKTILIDCGNDVGAKLMEEKLMDEIEYVFITHTHEDHISSLSTLIYYKKLIKNETLKIECVDSVAKKVETYLYDVCGHCEGDFMMNGNKGSADYFDLDMKIHKVDYGPNHTPRNSEFPASGFVFEFKFDGELLYIVYSGDINISFLDWLRTNESAIYKDIEAQPENVFIFHEATAFDYPNQPHCRYQILEKELELFPNIYTYHHDEKEAATMISSQLEELHKLEGEILEMDRDAGELLVGEHNSVENREAYTKTRTEMVKKLSDLKRKPKLISLTQIDTADFFIEKDNTL